MKIDPIFMFIEPEGPEPDQLKALNRVGLAQMQGLEHRAQNLKQIFAARMLYLKVLDRPDVLHK
jgi:hypothetical protein